MYRTPMKPTDTMRNWTLASCFTKFSTTVGSSSGGVTPSQSAVAKAVGVASP